MKRSKKLSLGIVCALFALFVLFGFLSAESYKKSMRASAESTYFSAEQYTESDNILLSDATISVSRSIREFASDVLLGDNGQSFSEISQVIPLEYLESAEENAEFSCNCVELNQVDF